MIVAVNNKKHNTRMVFFPHLSMLGRLAITLIITIPQLSQQHHTCLAFAVAATSAASASSSSSSSSFALSGSNSHGRRRSTSTSSSRSMQHIEEDKQQQQRAEQDETKQEAPAADTDTETTVLDLHSAQTRGSPAQTLHDLATFCENDGIDTFDVYGDFSSSKTSSSSHSEEEASSYLRAFESEIATTFGKQDAVFMPSGVMAQSIALLIHASSSSSSQISSSLSKKNNNNSAGNSNGNRNNEEQSKRKTFACHRTSHLLLHENEGYADLLHMDAVILPLEEPTPIGGIVGGTYATPPMRFHDVQALFSSRMPDAEAGATTPTTRTKKPQQQQHHERLSCLMLELPHRELGGKLTPYEEVVAMSRLCRTHGVAFHCDGARIFEAAAGYTILSNKKKNNNDGGGDISVQEIAQQFDSIYISCYKGLGGLSGAMLLGDVQFCNEARIWLRRFGGNLYTLLPYVVAAKRGYRLHVDDNKNGSTRKNSNSNSSSNNDNMLMMMSFKSKTEKLQRIVQSITCNDDINDDNDDDNDATSDAPAVVTFDPKIPATNMVHGYIRASFDECHNAIAAIEASLGVTILNRVRPISKEQEQHEYKKGYRCRFEWTMGDSNGTIEDAIFITAWKEFIRILSS